MNLQTVEVTSLTGHITMIGFCHNIVTTLSRHLSFLLCILSVDFIVCAIGSNVYPEEGDLIIITDVDPGIERLVITDLTKLTDSIRFKVLESTLAVACQIGRVVRREGKPIGAILILGDSLQVTKWSGQLVPNPFHGHEDRLQRITNPDTHDALVEFSKLDGAFVIRGDGFIQSAGVFFGNN